jgi:hypothetical protein
MDFIHFGSPNQHDSKFVILFLIFLSFFPDIPQRRVLALPPGRGLQRRRPAHPGRALRHSGKKLGLHDKII